MGTSGGILAIALLCASTGCDGANDDRLAQYDCPALSCPSNLPICVKVGQSLSCVSEDQQRCLSPIDTQLTGSGVRVADLNGDGLTDLIFQGNYALRAARGSVEGGFQSASEVAPDIKSFAVLETSEPGAPELVVLDSRGNTQFLASDGVLTTSGSTPSPTSRYASILGVTDVDADGQEDVLLLQGTDRLVALLSTLNFATSSLPLSPPREPERAFALDTDGDGTPELFVGGSEGLLSIYRFDRDMWAPLTTLRGQLAGVADLNADGISDLVLNRLDVRTAHVELGRADGTFESQAEIMGSAFAVADLDADRNVDLMLSRVETFVRLDGQGDGTFQEASPLDVHASPDSAGLVATSAGTQLAFSTGGSWIQTVNPECLAQP